MLNRNRLLLAAAIVAVGAVGTANADPYNHNLDAQSMQSDSSNDDAQRAYGNGYNNGYEDGMARHDRNDRYRSDRYMARAEERSYQRGSYYYGSDCESNAAAGTVAGAIAGGVIGNQFGHGDGRTAATFGGIILGGIAGNAIASDMSCNDRHYAFASYSNGFEGRIGHRYNWRGGDGGNYGYFIPVREFSRDRMTCRDFRTVSYRHNREYTRTGTACRQTDGNWYMQ